MEKNTEKRVLRVALNDEVKRVSITGTDSDEKVVMRQELDEDELELATGGVGTRTGYLFCITDFKTADPECDMKSR